MASVNEVVNLILNVQTKVDDATVFSEFTKKLSDDLVSLEKTALEAGGGIETAFKHIQNSLRTGSSKPEDFLKNLLTGDEGKQFQETVKLFLQTKKVLEVGLEKSINVTPFVDSLAKLDAASLQLRQGSLGNTNFAAYFNSLREQLQNNIATFALGRSDFSIEELFSQLEPKGLGQKSPFLQSIRERFAQIKEAVTTGVKDLNNITIDDRLDILKKLEKVLNPSKQASGITQTFQFTVDQLKTAIIHILNVFHASNIQPPADFFKKYREDLRASGALTKNALNEIIKSLTTDFPSIKENPQFLHSLLRNLGFDQKSIDQELGILESSFIKRVKTLQDQLSTFKLATDKNLPSDDLAKVRRELDALTKTPVIKDLVDPASLPLIENLIKDLNLFGTATERTYKEVKEFEEGMRTLIGSIKNDSALGDVFRPLLESYLQFEKHLRSEQAFKTFGESANKTITGISTRLKDFTEYGLVFKPANITQTSFVGKDNAVYENAFKEKEKIVTEHKNKLEQLENAIIKIEGRLLTLNSINPATLNPAQVEHRDQLISSLGNTLDALTKQVGLNKNAFNAWETEWNKIAESGDFARKAVEGFYDSLNTNKTAGQIATLLAMSAGFLDFSLKTDQASKTVENLFDKFLQLNGRTTTTVDTLERARTAIVDLFTNKGRISAVFPLEKDFNAAQGISDELRKKVIALSEGGASANEQFAKLIELANTLNTIGAGESNFGKQILALAELAKESRNFKDSLKITQNDNDLANTSVLKLQGDYEHLTKLVKEYNELKNKGDLESQTKAETKLKEINHLYSQINRTIESVNERVARALTRQELLSKSLDKASSESSSNFNFLNITLDNTLKSLTEITKKVVQLKTDSKGIIDFNSLTNATSSAKKTLADQLESLQTSLSGGLNKIFSGLKIEGLSGAFENSLKTEFNSILKSLNEGDFSSALTQINILFEGLKKEFTNQTSNLNSAEAVEKIVRPWQALAKELDVAITNAVNIVASKEPFLRSNFNTSENATAITAEFEAISNGAKAAKTTIKDFTNTLETASRTNLLTNLTADLEILKNNFTELKNTKATPESLYVFEERLNELRKEIAENKKELKDLNSLNFANLIVGAAKLKAEYKDFVSTNSSGLQNNLSTLERNFNALTLKSDGTRKSLEELFKQHYEFKNLTFFNPKVLESLGDKIREALTNATKGSDEHKELTLLETRWKELTALVKQYNAVIKNAHTGNLGADLVSTRENLDSVQTRVTGLNSALIANRMTLTDYARTQEFTAEQARDLARSFQTVENKSKQLASEIGALQNTSKSLESIINSLKTANVATDDPLLTLLQGLQGEIKAVVESKRKLDESFAKGFIGNVESDLNRILAAKNALEQVQQIKTGFERQDFFTISASNATELVRTIQRLRSSLNTIKGDLEKSLAVPKLGQINPQLKVQLDAQLAAVEANEKALQRYQQVYSQLQSVSKVKDFEKLKDIYADVGISRFETEVLRAVKSVTDLVNILKSADQPLANNVVDDFKKQTKQVDETKASLERYITILKGFKEGGLDVLPTGTSGETVPIKDLLDTLLKLQSTIIGIQPAIRTTAQELENRLGTAAGQAELRISTLIEKFASLQTAINSVTPGNSLNETYGSLRNILSLLERPLPQTPFFTLPKEEFANFKNELTSAITVAKNVVTGLTFNLSELNKQEGVDPKKLQQGTAALEEARRMVTELQRGLQQLSEAEKNTSNFSPLKDSLHGAATNLAELAHEGAFIYKGLDALFKGIATKVAPKVELNADPAIEKVKELTKGLTGLENFAKDAEVAIKNVFSQQGNKGGILAAEQYKLAFEELETAFVKFHSGLSQAAMGFQMLGDSLLEPFKKAKEHYETFSDTMGVVNAVTNTTSENFEKLTQQAILMGATTRFTSEQAAEGLKALAKAGFTAEQQLAALPSVMRLAQAAATEIAMAAQIATVVMAEFRMDPEQFTQASDAIALAANRTLASVEDLGYSFKYVGALASNIGADFNHLTASMALLHNAGLKGTLAGTALRGILQRLYNPTKQNAEALAEISDRIGGVGLRLQDASGKFIGFSQVVKQLEQAGVSSGEVLKIFGQRAGPGMAALLAQGSEALMKLEKDLDNASGTTAHMADIMEHTLKGKTLLMLSAFEALSDQIGHNLSGALETAADVVGNFVSKFVALREAFPSTATFFDELLGGLALVASVLGGLAVSFAFVIVPVRQFFGFLKTLVVTTLAGAGAITASTAASAFNAKAVDLVSGALEREIATLVIQGNLKRVEITQRYANIAAIEEEVAATLSAITAQRTSAASSGLLFAGLKNIGLLILAVFKDVGLILQWLTRSFLGWATILTVVVVAATYLYGKSTRQLNEELKKQNELLAYSKKEATGLSETLVDTASEFKNLNSEYLELLKNKETPKSEILQFEVKLNLKRAELNEQLRDLFTRLTEESSAYKDKLFFNVSFDDKGNFTKFKIQMKDSGKTIDVLANGIEGAAEQLQKLKSELTQVIEAQQEFITQQEFSNSLHDSLGANSFLQGFKNLIGIGAQIKGVSQDITEYERRIRSLQATIKRGVALHQSKSELDFLMKELTLVQNLLAEAQIKKSGILDSTVVDTTKRLTAELKLTEAEIAATPNLNDLITEKLTLYFKDSNINPEYFDSVRQRLQEHFFNLANSINKTELVSTRFKKPFNEIISLVVDFDNKLAKKNEDLQKRVKEQDSLFNDAKPLVDGIKAYKKALIDFNKQTVDQKTKTLELNIKINKDTIVDELTQQIEQLTLDNKVIELPFSIKSQFLSSDVKLSGIKSVAGIILNYEKSVNLELLQFKLAQMAVEYKATVNLEKEKRELIKKSLSEISGSYAVYNEDFYKLEQEKQQAIAESLKTEYEATRTHVEKLYALRNGLIQKSQQLDNDYTSRQAEATANLQKLYLSGKTDKEKQNFAREQINSLKDLADKAARTGNFDRAKALLDQQQQIITQAINEIAGDKDAKSFDKYFLKNAQEQNVQDTGKVIGSLKAESAAAQAVLTTQIEQNKGRLQELGREAQALGVSLEATLKRLQTQTFLDIGITKESYENLKEFQKTYEAMIRELNTSAITMAIATTSPEQIKASIKRTNEAKQEQTENLRMLNILRDAKETLNPILNTQGVSNALESVVGQVTKLNSLSNNNKTFDSEQVTAYEDAVKAAQEDVKSLSIALNNSGIDKNSPLYQSINEFIKKIQGLQVGKALKDAIGSDSEGFVTQSRILFNRLKTEGDNIGTVLGEELDKGYLTALTETVPAIQQILEEAISQGSIANFRELFKTLHEAIDHTRTSYDSLLRLKDQQLLGDKDLTQATKLIQALERIQQKINEIDRQTPSKDYKVKPPIDEQSSEGIFTGQVKGQKELQDAVAVTNKTFEQQNTTIKNITPTTQQLSNQTAQIAQESNLLKDAWVLVAGTILNTFVPAANAATTEVKGLQATIENPVKEPINFINIFAPIKQAARDATTATTGALSSYNQWKYAVEDPLKTDTAAIQVFEAAENQINKAKDATLIFLQQLPKLKTESDKITILGTLKEKIKSVLDDTKTTFFNFLETIKESVSKVIYVDVKVNKEQILKKQTPYEVYLKIADKSKQEIQDTLTSNLNLLHEYNKPQIVDIRYMYQDQERIDKLIKKLKELRSQQPQGIFKEPLVDSAEIKQVEKLLSKELSKPVLLDTTDAVKEDKELQRNLSKPISVDLDPTQIFDKLTALRAVKEKLSIQPEINTDAFLQLDTKIKQLEQQAIQLQLPFSGTKIKPLGRDSIINSGEISQALKDALNESKQFEKGFNTTTKQGVDLTVDTFSKGMRRLTATGFGTDGKKLTFPIPDFSTHATTWDGLIEEGNKYLKLVPQIEVGHNLEDSLKDASKNLPKVVVPAVIDPDIKPDTSKPTEKVDTLNKELETLTSPKTISITPTIEGKEGLDAVSTQVTTLTEKPFTTLLTAITDQANSALTSVRDTLDGIHDKKITIFVDYQQGDIPSIPANTGGLIPSVQHFAKGGIAKFKELATQFVPGTGNTDTVPAMLTPGEYVIKKDRVKELGVGFLNALNNGLIQFKSAGGMVYDAPINTLNAMAKYVQPNYNMPKQDLQTANGGPPVNINLTIKDKTFNITTPRSEAQKLVTALQYLERGITKR